MRSYQEIIETARDVSPFSNGTEWEMWAAHWCWRPCMNPVELAYQRWSEGEGPEPSENTGGCPLILAAMMGKTPTEWLEQPDDNPDRYHCIEFRREEGEGEEPQPIPDPPGQGTLFAREPFTCKLARGVQELNTGVLA